jgi:hypothetical protein
MSLNRQWVSDRWVKTYNILYVSSVPRRAAPCVANRSIIIISPEVYGNLFSIYSVGFLYSIWYIYCNLHQFSSKNGHFTHKSKRSRFQKYHCSEVAMGNINAEKQCAKNSFKKKRLLPLWNFNLFEIWLYNIFNDMLYLIIFFYYLLYIITHT